MQNGKTMEMVVDSLYYLLLGRVQRKTFRIQFCLCHLPELSWLLLKIAETVGAAYIHVPVIGLADGIIDELCLKKEKEAQGQAVTAPASGIPAPTHRQ